MLVTDVIERSQFMQRRKGSLSRVTFALGFAGALASASSASAADPPPKPPSASPAPPPSLPAPDKPAAPSEAGAPQGQTFVDTEQSNEPRIKLLAPLSGNSVSTSATDDKTQPPAPLWPKRLDYEEGDYILPEYTLQTKANRGLVVGGVVTFSVSYGLSLFVGGIGALSGDRGGEAFGTLILPLAGPFIAISTSDADPFGTYVLLLDGFTQIAGAAMFTAGLLVPDKYLERAAKLPGKPELMLGGKSAALKLHF
jgi:hypothetical protein